jgi:hypothetical protein
VAFDGTPGVHRTAWNLREIAPPAPGAAPAAGRGGGGGGRGGGRGGGGGPAVDPGRYTARLVRITGGSATPIGAPQSFHVKPISD